MFGMFKKYKDKKKQLEIEILEKIPKIGDLYQTSCGEIIYEIVYIDETKEEKYKLKHIKINNNYFPDNEDDYKDSFILGMYTKISKDELEQIKIEDGFIKPYVGMYLYIDDGFDYILFKITGIGRNNTFKYVMYDENFKEDSCFSPSNLSMIGGNEYYKPLTKDNVLEIEPRLKDKV